MTLVLPAPVWREIATAARAARPSEACGLLVGRGRRRVVTTHMVPSVNLLAPSADRFEVDPRVRLRVEKEVRGTVERLIGHWHSHPEADPVPSATDLAMVFEPDLIWLIVGFGPGGVPNPAAWRFWVKSKVFKRVPLEITQENACIPPGFPT